MANEFDNTALNATIKELWDEKVEDARYAEGVLMNRISNKSGIASKKGDVIHVTIDQKLTVGAVASDGSFTPQNYTPTTVDVSLNQWEQVSIKILDRAEAQSFWTPDSKFPTSSGKAYANQYDGRIAALWSSVANGNTVGDIATPPNFDKMLAQEAMLRLADQNIPMDELSWVVRPSAYFNGICNEIQLTAADQSGASQNLLMTSKGTNGQGIPLFGHPMFISTNIVKTGSPEVYKNLLLHKSAIAIAWQKNGEFERTRLTPTGVFGELLASQSLYGQNVIRSDHFIVINSAA